MKKTIVIIGGVAGGASAAARLRRLNEEDDIIMFERGEHISFANCGLPYYIGDTITSRSKLLIQTPQAMYDRFGIDVRVLTEVASINRESKKVIARRVDTGEILEQTYDVLILSPGAKPILPDIPGLADAKSVFTLRNIPDTDRIRTFVDEQKPANAVVVGGGFIGIEMAENLHARGVHVTLVERNAQILGPLDPEMAAIVEQHMRLKGIDIRLGDGVEAIEQQGSIVRLSSGAGVPSDLLLLAIGVSPENELAKQAGLELGVRGAIRVNEHLQTSDPSIYAVGDAIEVKDRIHQFETMVPLAWGANRQGRLVADHIQGRPASYKGAYGTAIVKVFDLTAAVTGNNESTLRRHGISYETIHIHPSSHAGYYPGAAPISLKLLFDKTRGTIYGAQAIGADGVDKRIDVIAAAMRGGLSAMDLADIELAYAPPYSSAKDPVNMAGYVASNIVEGLVRTMQWHEVDTYVQNGGMLIDVRDAIEREMGFIPGSISIPLNDLRSRLSEIPQDQDIAVSCQVGLRGYIAARLLEQHGYRVRNVDGGYKTYAVMRRECETASYGASGANGNSVNQLLCNASVPTGSPPQPETTSQKIVLIDACGLQCPGPIVKVYEALNDMEIGDQLEVHATDLGFASDIAKWCEKTGNTLHSVDTEAGIVKAIIRKGDSAAIRPTDPPASREGATMVIFSGDLDKTIAAFIIATGAASMGKKVTLFFTFWGLNILRKPDAPAVSKSGLDKMFSMMMPNGTGSLPLSKMNMAGIGPKMIRHVMDTKNVASVESLMAGALKAGVRFVACTMSMDIMGIKREELIDGIDYAGVASYLGDAEDANLNLFI